MRLSEGFLQNGVPSRELWKKLSACAADSVIGVRYQLAFTLGEIRHEERVGVLAQIVRRDVSERMVRTGAPSDAIELVVVDERGDVVPRPGTH